MFGDGLLLCCDFYAMIMMAVMMMMMITALYYHQFSTNLTVGFCRRVYCFLLASNCIETTYNALTQLKAIIKIVFFIVQKR